MGAAVEKSENTEVEQEVEWKGMKLKFIKGIPPEHCIPRVDSLTPEQFEQYFYKTGKPIIITNGIQQWPALSKWNTEYLKQEIGKQTHTFWFGKKSINMKVSDYIDTAVALFKNQDKITEQPPIEELKSEPTQEDKKEIKRPAFPELPVSTEKLPYIRHFGPLDKRAPTLANDIRPECFFSNPSKIIFRNFIFVGVPGTRTDTHYDGSDNFVAIIFGQKHVALLPPNGEQEMNIPAEAKKSLANFDPFPLTDPDNLVLDLSKKTTESIMMHQHPAFSSAKKI